MVEAAGVEDSRYTFEDEPLLRFSTTCVPRIPTGPARFRTVGQSLGRAIFASPSPRPAVVGRDREHVRSARQQLVDDRVREPSESAPSEIAGEVRVRRPALGEVLDPSDGSVVFCLESATDRGIAFGIAPSGYCCSAIRGAMGAGATNVLDDAMKLPVHERVRVAEKLLE
jgi:hypothetical protein